MRNFRIFIVLLLAIFIFSCKKDNKSYADCDPNAPMVRTITDGAATIKEVASKFYIAEQGTIETILNPCNLPTEFQVENLEVIISGDVKAPHQPMPTLCCTENFVITKISR